MSARLWEPKKNLASSSAANALWHPGDPVGATLFSLLLSPILLLFGMADQPSPAQREAVEEQAAVSMAERLSPAEKQALAEERIPSSLPCLPKMTASHTALPAKSTNGTTKEGQVPGVFVEGPHNLPAWYKVGWTSFSDLPNPGDEDAMKAFSGLTEDARAEMYASSRTSDGRASSDLIAQFLKEAYYGEWYHNTAAMFFAVFFTWLLTKLGGGLMACLVVGAFLGRLHILKHSRLFHLGCTCRFQTLTRTSL